MKIKCLAIDDEPFALRQLADFIERTPFLVLVGQCSSGYEVLELLPETQVDLMFVDIQMPDLTGIELIKSIENGPRVIFTTAYEEYAIEGFKVDAIDYILKPFGYPEFLKAANKARSYFELMNKANTQINANEECLFIKSDYKIMRIEFDDIQFVEGMREYVKLHLLHTKPVMTLMSMKSIEEKLPTSKFMRVHRSFIVNLSRITIIERNRIVFNNNYIPISDQYKEKFQEYLDKFFIK
jgi:two-component system LytT family response regulator